MNPDILVLTGVSFAVCLTIHLTVQGIRARRRRRNRDDH